jgi:hypothetical protein
MGVCANSQLFCQAAANCPQCIVIVCECPRSARDLLNGGREPRRRDKHDDLEPKRHHPYDVHIVCRFSRAIAATIDP